MGIWGGDSSSQRVLLIFAFIHQTLDFRRWAPLPTLGRAGSTPVSSPLAVTYLGNEEHLKVETRHYYFF